MKIALLGRLRSGKSTAMNILIEEANKKYGIDLIPKPLADPIYKEAKSFYERNGLVWRKNRRLLEEIGKAFNEDYPNGDKIVELFDSTFDPNMNYIVEDARRITQADYLIKKGFILIRVEASEDIRRSRCNPGEFSTGHITDVELDNYPVTHIIDNNTDNIEDLTIQCENILDFLYKLNWTIISSRF